MVVNRYTLLERGVSLKDITAIQRKAAKLIEDKCSFKTTKHENKICNVLYFETTELIEALKIYKVKLRSDCIEATNKLIKILEGLEMPKDNKFCNTKDCIHRRGCSRFIGNHEGTFEPLEWINEVECKNEEIEEDFDGYVPAYIHLDRFSYSDGSSMK